VKGFDAFSFGSLDHVCAVHERPSDRQRFLVGHVADPHQVTGDHRVVCVVDTGDHAICSVHEKRDGAVINFHPLVGVGVVNKPAEGQEHVPFPVVVHHFNDDGCFVEKHHAPRSERGHFKEGSVHVEVEVEVLLKTLEQRSDVFPSHGSSFLHRPILSHACPCRTTNMSLRSGDLMKADQQDGT